MDDLQMLLLTVGDLEVTRRKLLIHIQELEARIQELEPTKTADGGSPDV